MKTNFQEWVTHYESDLIPYYHDFAKMFSEEKKTPTFIDFAMYCFQNTKQNYNHAKRRYEARIY